MKKLLLTLLIFLLTLVAIAQPGTLDTTFNPGNGPNASVDAIAVQSNGKIIMGGSFTTYNGINRYGVARLNTNGSLDVNFIPGTAINDQAHSIAILNNGKIIVGGSFANSSSSYGLFQLNTDGSFDSGFISTGTIGTVNAIAVQSDGKILVGGDLYYYDGIVHNGIARLNSNGSIDTTFNPGTGTNYRVRTLKLQGDGKILMGGDFTSYNGSIYHHIVRLNSNGSIDASFNLGAGTNFDIYSIALQSSGKILIGGTFTYYNNFYKNYLARLNSDGSFDTSFNYTGPGPSSDVWSIAVQSDNKILIGGHFTGYNYIARGYVARLNSDGSLDGSFDPTGMGADYGLICIAFQNDGKILIGGVFSGYDNVPRNRIARLNGSPLTAVSAINLDKSIVVAPNPVKNLLHVKLVGNARPASIRITDLNGTEMLKRTKFISSFSLDMSSYSEGIYVVEIINEITAEKLEKRIIKL